MIKHKTLKKIPLLSLASFFIFIFCSLDYICSLAIDLSIVYSTKLISISISNMEVILITQSLSRNTLSKHSLETLSRNTLKKHVCYSDS